MKSVLNLMSIEKNICIIREKISLASKGRLSDNGEIVLVAVTKTVDKEKIKEALELGIKDIAESRVQEAITKFSNFENSLIGIKKHFIGHLQTNKVKKVVEKFDLIQSVDSLKLAIEINNYAEILGKIQDCLIEIKVSQEQTKFGVSLEDAEELINNFSGLKNIQVCGFMTISPFFDNPEHCRPCFEKTKELFDRIRQNYSLSHFKILSMGMSNDFMIAIEQGSNMVRIGTAIFGERINP